jgi:hypothetical protein
MDNINKPLIGRYETALERGMYQAMMMLGTLREGKLAE